jgi:tetratricopeptide (TPR) repeat protein
MSASDQLIVQKKREALELLNNNRLTEARAVYLDLSGRDSADAEVWFMLGSVEGSMGNISAAEKAMSRALEIDETFAKAWLGLGKALELQGRIEDAVNHYLRALNINPDLAEAHASLGRLYFDLERLPQSIEHFWHAINLGITRPKLMLGYADALRYHGNLKDALRIYEELVSRFPQDTSLHYRLGHLYLVLSDLERARQHFVTGLKIDPGQLGCALGEITVLRMQKKPDEALAKIKPLFETMKENFQVALAYADLCHVDKECRRVIHRLESLLGSGRVPQQGAVGICFKLGKLYDRQGEYDKAFACYQRGNDLKKGPYDVEENNAVTNALIKVYNKERLVALPKANHDDTRPVFIVGMPRSGSSLIEQILASHPDVCGGGELIDMTELMFEVHKGSLDIDRVIQETEQLSVEGLNRLAAKYSAAITARSSGEKFVTDKMPSNFLRLGFISLLFPRARIIHSRRDPFDTCLSCYFSNFSTYHPYTNDFDRLGNFFKNYQRLMQHWHEVLPLPILDVDYEKVVSDQEGETRRMLDFLGLDWDDRCLQFYKSNRVTVTASSAQVQKPIYQGSVARWKYYEKFLEPLKAALV